MPVCSFARQVASGVHSKEESGEEKKGTTTKEKENIVPFFI